MKRYYKIYKANTSRGKRVVEMSKDDFYLDACAMTTYEGVEFENIFNKASDENGYDEGDYILYIRDHKIDYKGYTILSTIYNYQPMYNVYSNDEGYIDNGSGTEFYSIEEAKECINSICNKANMLKKEIKNVLTKHDVDFLYLEQMCELVCDAMEVYANHMLKNETSEIEKAKDYIKAIKMVGSLNVDLWLSMDCCNEL